MTVQALMIEAANDLLRKYRQPAHFLCWRTGRAARHSRRQSTVPLLRPVSYLALSLGLVSVVNRQLITGRNKIAGDHNPLPWAGENERPGPSCYCGKSGCIETFLSGASLARDYHTCTGLNPSARDIALAVTARDHNAAECLDAYKNRPGNSKSPRRIHTCEIVTFLNRGRADHWSVAQRT